MRKLIPLEYILLFTLLMTLVIFFLLCMQIYKGMIIFWLLGLSGFVFLVHEYLFRRQYNKRFKNSYFLSLFLREVEHNTDFKHSLIYYLDRLHAKDLGIAGKLKKWFINISNTGQNPLYYRDHWYNTVDSFYVNQVIMLFNAYGEKSLYVKQRLPKLIANNDRFLDIKLNICRRISAVISTSYFIIALQWFAMLILRWYQYDLFVDFMNGGGNGIFLTIIFSFYYAWILLMVYLRVRTVIFL